MVESIFQPATAGVVQKDRGPALWHAYLAIVTLFLLNSIWFIWSHRFLPLGDYPDWLYQGFILSKFIRHSAPAAFSLKLYPIPYSTFTVVLGVLDLVLPPETSGKVLLTLMVFAFVLGSLYFLTSLQVRETPLLYVPLVLCFNSFFFGGTCSYYLALGMLFFVCGYLLRTGRAGNGALVAVMLVVLLMTHLLPYLAAVALIAIVAAYSAQAPRRPRNYQIADSSSPVCHAADLVCTRSAAVRGLGGAGLDLVEKLAPFRRVVRLRLGAFPRFPAVGHGAESGHKRGCPTQRPVGCDGGGRFRRGAQGGGVVQGARAGSSTLCRLVRAGFVAAGYYFGGANTGERFLLPALWFACCWLTSLQVLRVGKAAVLLRLFLVGMVAAQVLWLDTVAAEAAGRLDAVYHEMKAASDRSFVLRHL